MKKVKKAGTETQKYSTVLTAVTNEKEGDKIAHYLLDHNLAACIQMFPMKATYIWRGEKEVAHEFLLMIKTLHKNYKKVETAILKLHSYETPEITEMPFINGSDAFLAWIDENVK